MARGADPRWIISRLFNSGLIRPGTLLALARAWRASGANLVALARFGASTAQPPPMLIDEQGSVSLAGLAEEAERLAAILWHAHQVAPGEPIGILGENSVALVRALLAASRLGARAILLNPHLPAAQLAQLLDRHGIRVILAAHYTGGLAEFGRTVCDPDALRTSHSGPQPPLPRMRAGEIVVLTGGTTGLPKAARRKAGATSVLRLFLHLIAALQLERRRSVFVAVPLFHGFGLAALIMALALGRTAYLRRRFDAPAVAALIESEAIDTVAVVPTMLQRLLPHLGQRRTLRCIVSGGAPLAPQLAGQVRAQYGDVLFNLYGTSEAGLSLLATPGDLAIAPGTIGRPVWGAAVAIRDAADGIGALFIRNRASVSPGEWLGSGDLASRDSAGRLFLHGRVDDMILSGGENVSPWEVESILLTHPDIADVAAVGVPDPDYGQRLAVAVVAREGCRVEAAGLQDWLRPRIARHQVPRHIAVMPALPLTAIGKVDRKALGAQFS
ncbi:class I adenylate-forming enzyme family protein [Sphingomonas sp.]|uniref:class I adenylate-forming enzyme family protein n=1 Tax=Sphingomonas sp. TaxID=28214 RepID=UPI003B3A2DA7